MKFLINCLLLQFFCFSFAYSQSNLIGIKLRPDLAKSTTKTKWAYPKYTFGGGVQIIFNLMKIKSCRVENSGTSIETGIYLINRGYLIKDTAVVNDGYFFENAKKVFNDFYLHVPIMLRLQTGSFYMGAGPSFDYYLYSKDKIINFDNDETRILESLPDKRNISCSFLLYTGLSMRLDKNTNFFMEVILNPMLMSYSKVSGNLYINYGVGIGINTKI